MIHTQETKARIKEIYVKIKHQQGTKNSQFGTMWINDGTSDQKIASSKDIPEGFVKGRLKIKREVKCPGCQKIYIKKKKIQKYCSRSCNAKFSIKVTKDKELESLRKSNTRKALFASGKINVTGGTTKWFSYTDKIKVQGSYELRTCKILDTMKERNLILDWEYTKDRIPYLMDGNTHSYLLDFKVIDINGSVYYIETKGYATEKDLCKWESAKKQIDLVVWFLEDIIKKEVELDICALDES